MHVITQKRIWLAKQDYPESANALEAWYRIIKTNQFDNFAQLKKCFRSLDKVDHLCVFDISGNKIRLIASIHFSGQKIYIRHILPHKEYDNGQWRN